MPGPNTCWLSAKLWRRLLADRKEFVWKEETAKIFAEKCKVILAHSAWLAKDSMNKKVYQWSLVQKHHMLAHFPSQCRFLAPRACWTYWPESFMPIVTSIASASVKGTPAWMLSKKVLEKFELAFHVLLQGLWNPELEEVEEG